MNTQRLPAASPITAVAPCAARGTSDAPGKDMKHGASCATTTGLPLTLDLRVHLIGALLLGWIVVSELLAGHGARAIAGVAFLVLVSGIIWTSGAGKPAEAWPEEVDPPKVRKVRGSMTTSFATLSADATIIDGIGLLLHANQRAVAVLDGDCFVGLVSASTLYESALVGRSGDPICSVCHPLAATLRPDDGVETAIDRFEDSDEDTLPVFEGGRLVGLLHQENLLRDDLAPEPS